MKHHPQYVLTRWGQHYACWGDSPEEVWTRFRGHGPEAGRKPDWLLRLLGWGVGFDPEGIPRGLARRLCGRRE